MLTYKVTKKTQLFHTSSLLYFPFIFSEYITSTSSKEALRVCKHNFFQKI